MKRHPEDSYEGNCPFHGDCLEGMAAGPAIEKRWGKKGHELAEDHPAWEMEAYYLAHGLVNYILVITSYSIHYTKLYEFLCCSKLVKPTEFQKYLVGVDV